MILHTSDSIVPLLAHLKHYPTVVLYVGPDQIMPLTSVLGALLGVALMFWNRLVGFAHKCRSVFSRRASDAPKEPTTK